MKALPIVWYIAYLTLLGILPAPGHTLDAQASGKTNPIPSPPIAPPYPPTDRVSLAWDGREGDQHSGDIFEPNGISADGRFAVFSSTANNLVPGDTNNASDIFVRDRLNGTTLRVSVSSTGVEGNNNSYSPSISADGRFVGFYSDANNLVPGDTDNQPDVFLHDMQTGTTEWVSMKSNGQPGGGTGKPAISADGRFVAFTSSIDLVPDDTNGGPDIYLRDRLAGTTTRVSVSNNPSLPNANGPSSAPAVSSDGRYIAFESTASNLVNDDTNGKRDVFVRDMLASSTEIDSVSSAGVEGNNDSQQASLSPDGRFIAFSTLANNLVAGDTNNIWDVYLRDRQAATTVRVSLASNGSQGSGGQGSVTPSVNGDGRFVAFSSDVNGLVPGDNNQASDIFVRDVQANTTEQISISAWGVPGNQGSYQPQITPDARFVVFDSNATNLVSGDTNNYRDVFVRDRATCTLAFTDVPPGSAYSSYVHCLTCLGILSGYPCGGPGEPCVPPDNNPYLRPNSNITRGQVSKLVSNSAGFSDAVTTQTYEDVPPSSAFYLFVGRLSGRGIMGGYLCGGPGEPCVPPDNRPYFRPNANASRGQIAKIVANAAGFTGDPPTWTFQDVAPGSTFHPYVEQLSSRSVMGGYPCGGPDEPCVPPDNKPYFRPNAQATRGQVAKIVDNTFFPGCSVP